MAPERDPVADSIPSTTLAELAERTKANRLKPAWADINAIQPGCVVDHDDGTREAKLDLTRPKVRGAYKEVMAGYIRAEGERCGNWNASAERVTLAHPVTGARSEVDIARAPLAVARGLRELPMRGRANALVAPDGTLHRLLPDGSTEPTGHTHMGEPLPWTRLTCPGCRAEAYASLAGPS